MFYETIVCQYPPMIAAMFKQMRKRDEFATGIMINWTLVMNARSVSTSKKLIQHVQDIYYF